ncbi:MAG: alpha/beta fold hydrolase [Patescibacteria group bacterium]|nr:alpha/beta fold hydrolase [Patescibacteria group bacterium]MBU1876988.1 alpha/beta fold hydrolase [Patescibacteria group bacterium]
MLKRVLIIHGWEASSKDNWFLEEKERLEKLGYEVVVPDMPNTLLPKKDEWVQVIKDSNPDENSILIGHSLGGTAILRYLEETSDKIGKCILVATPIRKLENNEFDSSPIYNFFELDIDYQKIKQNCREFVIINQTNDPFVPLQDGRDLAKYTNGNLKVLEGNNHLCEIDLNLLEECILK